MAFPVVESKVGTGRTAAETTSPITYPATISAGALLICIFRSAAAGAIGWAAGWNELVEDSSDASDDVTAIAWRAAVGDEDGTTFNVTHGSGKATAIVYSIIGAAPPAVQPPQLSTVAVGTRVSPNPTTCTPTGGAKDYLWLWLGGWENEQTSPPTGTPLNYINPIGASTGTVGVVALNCRVASAQRNLNAASEDPPLWTISVSDDWSAWTMAIHPATIVDGAASGSGAGLASSLALLDIIAQAQASGLGLAQATAKLDILAQTSTSGTGEGVSDALLDIIAQAQGNGIGSAEAAGEVFAAVVIVEGTGTGSGVGLATAQSILDVLAQASGIGAGLAEAIGECIILEQVAGSGIGNGQSAAKVIVLSQASGEGIGTSLATALTIVLAEAIAAGVGNAEAEALVTEIAEAIGSGVGVGEATGWIVTDYGILKRWTGSDWVKVKLLVYWGGAWVAKPLKRWSGSQWLEVDTTGS